MNDPNGLIRVDGRTHVFFQHNPAAPVWEDILWGHASSTDLVRWRAEPIALRPSPGGPDADGCWSGSAVMTPQGPVIFYTGRRGTQESICRAFGDAELRSWWKDPANPLIEPPSATALTDFRDPKVWQAPDGWHMIVGAGLASGAGTVLHLRSADLASWELLGPILTGRSDGRQEVWECPDLFSVDGRDVLMYSVTPGSDSTFYVLGAWDGSRFVPEREGSLDLGPSFYAAQALVERDGRVILWGWLREGRSVEAQRAAGWSGMLSIPRSLSVTPDGRLAVAPIRELESLRRAGAPVAGARRLGAGERWQFLTDAGWAWEARIRFSAAPGGRLGLQLCASPDGAEITVLECDIEAGTVLLDRTNSSLADGTEADARTFDVRSERRDALELRLFIDGTSIEAFIDGISLSARVYPSRPDSTGLALIAAGGPVQVESIEWWPLAVPDGPELD